MVCSSTPKVAKAANLQYLLTNDYCYDLFRTRWWAFSHTSILKMSPSAIQRSSERASYL